MHLETSNYSHCICRPVSTRQCRKKYIASEDARRHAVPEKKERIYVSREVKCMAHAPDKMSIGEDVEYKDSLSDIAFIAMCRKAYGSLAGWQSSKSWWKGHETYAGMVEVSRALMKDKTADEQQSAVIAGFPAVPAWFRRLFPYSKWGAEVNAWITPIFFRWLVGPMETRVVEVDGKEQKSSVHITKCRYLAESNCAGMCVNLCKTPVQTFFTRELGMPLTMKPNFEEYSCEMVFGEIPGSKEDDEAYSQPCLQSCPSAKTSQRKCVKLQ